ncbi:MAG TPA: peptidase M14, partial [Solibacterales bacterium]|nr:peptidase M14 [Bryobacterales bacterium]
MRPCWLLVACCALGAAVPTPESHFGHKIGVDRQLLDWDQVTSYFYKLGKASDKIRVREYGKSVDGRPLIVATIAAPDTLRHLDRYLEQQRRLADPRITSPAEAERFIADGKNVVLITCSIHATEVASTHSAVEFAYRLITEDSPRFRAILQNDIVLLVPSLNPDGVDIVTRWYRQTLGTPYEGSSPPELWQRYIGHDNNRDWYIFSQPETRATVSQLHNVWHPQIVYDVHQQGPRGARLFVPPWL